MVPIHGGVASTLNHRLINAIPTGIKRQFVKTSIAKIVGSQREKCVFALPDAPQGRAKNSNSRPITWDPPDPDKFRIRPNPDASSELFHGCFRPNRPIERWAETGKNRSGQKGCDSRDGLFDVCSAVEGTQSKIPFACCAESATRCADEMCFAEQVVKELPARHSARRF